MLFSAPQWGHVAMRMPRRLALLDARGQLSVTIILRSDGDAERAKWPRHGNRERQRR